MICFSELKETLVYFVNELPTLVTEDYFGAAMSVFVDSMELAITCITIGNQ